MRPVKVVAESGVLELIQKPFDAQRLRRVVHRELDQFQGFAPIRWSIISSHDSPRKVNAA